MFSLSFSHHFTAVFSPCTETCLLYYFPSGFCLFIFLQSYMHVTHFCKIPKAKWPRPKNNRVPIHFFPGARINEKLRKCSGIHQRVSKIQNFRGPSSEPQTPPRSSWNPSQPWQKGHGWPNTFCKSWITVLQPGLGNTVHSFSMPWRYVSKFLWHPPFQNGLVMCMPS